MENDKGMEKQIAFKGRVLIIVVIQVLLIHMMEAYLILEGLMEEI